MKNRHWDQYRASTATGLPYLCRAKAAASLAVFALSAVLGGCNTNGSDGAPTGDADAAWQAERGPVSTGADSKPPSTDTLPPETPTMDAPVVLETNPAVDLVPATSPLQRETDPQVPTADMTALAAGNAAFAFDLYEKLKETNKDQGIVVSPASISLALAMTYAGARNRTATEMAETLHFTLPPERLHPAFNALEQALASRGQGLTGSDGAAMRLNIANSLWLEQTFRLVPGFLDTLAVNYGAGVTRVDFINTPDASRVKINAWVADHTAGKIDNLLAPGVIDSHTRLVLVNTMYFNAAWLNPFNALFNQANYFTLLDSTLTTKKYMYGSMSIGAIEGTGFVAASLPYQDTRLSMVVVVPDPGQFANVEAALDEASFATLIKGLTNRKVSLYLPPFHIDTRASLSSMLQALGMQAAFGGAADFSGMAAEPLYISAVVHEAFVNVAEKGTEAGAATAVVMADSGIAGDAGPPPLLIKADRPFLYFIYDQPTGTILFMGRVLDPAQS